VIAPYDAAGSLLRVATPDTPGVRWLPAVPWRDSLHLVGRRYDPHDTRRLWPWYLWRDKLGHRYPMCPRDMRIINALGIPTDWVTGLWTVRHYAHAFGIRLLTID